MSCSIDAYEAIRATQIQESKMPRYWGKDEKRPNYEANKRSIKEVIQ